MLARHEIPSGQLACGADQNSVKDRPTSAIQSMQDLVWQERGMLN